MKNNKKIKNLVLQMHKQKLEVVLRSMVSSIKKMENNLFEKTKKITDLSVFYIDIMDVFGMSRNEVRHTQTIKWIFSKESQHLLGYKILRGFLKQVVGVDRLANALSYNVFAEHNFATTERKKSNGQIDMLIEIEYKNQPKRAIVIENKIDDEARANQLKRYREYANIRYGSRVDFIYLTVGRQHIPDGAEESMFVNKWKLADYHDLAASIFLQLWVSNSSKNWNTILLEMLGASFLTGLEVNSTTSMRTLNTELMMGLNSLINKIEGLKR